MNKYIITLHIVFFSLFLVKGQINTYSPYSYFAVGQLAPIGNNYNISMGGLGTSLAPTKNLNYINPASYSSLDRTVFEFGMKSSFISMSDKNFTQNNFVSGLTEISLGFPISKKISLSASLLPYSSVGYSVRKESVVDGISVANIYDGSGGINKLLAGISLKIIDNISLGVGVNYLFGSIERETSLYSTESPWYFREINSKVIRGFNIDFGVLYFKKINDYTLNIGVTLRPGKDINTDLQKLQLLSGEVYDPSNPINIDLSDTISINEKTHFPLESAIGFSIMDNNKWLLGADYRYAHWSEYTESATSVCCMQSSHEFILGGWVVPNKNDIYNYFNRVQYRFGLSYSSGYLNFHTYNLEHFSGTFGLGLPINKSFSQANIAVKYGIIRSHETVNDNMQEKYFSIYLSMTLNEKWFQKLKIQ